MLVFDQEQHLGSRALWLLVARNTTFACILLLLGVLLFLGSGSIAGSLEKLAGASGIALSSINLAFEIIVLVLFAGGIILSLGGFLFSWISYRHYTFSLESYGLKITRGVFSKVQISIPYRQIQNVNVNRSLWYRLLGISKLVVISAGHEDPDLHDQTEGVLDPLDKRLAEEIQEELQRRIGVQMIEHDIPVSTPPITPPFAQPTIPSEASPVVSPVTQPPAQSKPPSKSPWSAGMP